jgi:hypothetical protein
LDGYETSATIPISAQSYQILPYWWSLILSNFFGKSGSKRHHGVMLMEGFLEYFG